MLLLGWCQTVRPEKYAVGQPVKELGLYPKSISVRQASNSYKQEFQIGVLGGKKTTLAAMLKMN